MCRLLYFSSEYFIIEKKSKYLNRSMNFGRHYSVFAHPKAVDCSQLFFHYIC